MCHDTLTQKGTVTHRSTVQRVTDLESQTDERKKTFDLFDEEIQHWLKHDDASYDGAKPDPEKWSELEEDEDFKSEFLQLFNNPEIPESDECALDVLDDTHLGIEVALPCDSEGPECARVIKHLRDANGLPIGTAHNNPVLNSRIHEVECQDAMNTFAQFDDEGNRCAIFDGIVDH